MGAANEAFRRSLSPNKSAHETSVFMSDANIKRLVDKLTRMRGAALKIGQFISIQGKRIFINFVIMFECYRFRCQIASVST